METTFWGQCAVEEREEDDEDAMVDFHFFPRQKKGVDSGGRKAAAGRLTQVDLTAERLKKSREMGIGEKRY